LDNRTDRVFPDQPSLSLPLLITGLIAACALYLVPLPLVSGLRLDLVALIVIYAAIYHPVNWLLRLGFCAGLLQDVVALSPLGQHALGLVLLAFIVPGMRDSLRMLPLQAQWLVVLGLLVFLKLLSGWVTALSLGILPGADAYWSAFATSLFWPLLVGAMHRMDRPARRPGR
jgi:rod shape-determining protein MreD